MGRPLQHNRPGYLSPHLTYTINSTPTTTRLILLPPNPRQTNPKHQLHSKQRQNNRLQNLHTPRLRQSANRKRENRASGATKRGCEPHSWYVQVFGQEFSGDDDDGGEEGAKEEPLEGNCYCGDVEGGD